MSLADEITWIRAALQNQGKNPAQIQAALEQHIRSKPAAEQQAFGAWMKGVAPQAAPVPPPQMSPDEVHAFGQQKSSIRDQYANQLAQLTFRRGQTAAEQGYQQADVGRQFDKFREKMPYGAIRRGISDSGIYQRGLQDYGQDRMRQMGEMIRRHQGVLSGFCLGAGYGLGVAFRALDEVPRAPEAPAIERDLCFVGLLGMIDPARRLDTPLQKIGHFPYLGALPPASPAARRSAEK